MSLRATKALFLYVAIVLAVCQDTRGFSTSTDVAANVTRSQRQLQYNDNYEYIDGDKDSVIIKISGGKHAKHGQFPFMAVVHQLLGGGKTSQCGGTIISRRWVLTAGHCLGSYPYPMRYLLVFGIIDKSGVGYDFNQGPGVSMIATQAIIHPQFDERTILNDIGLIRTPIDIPFSDIIQPIRLASHLYTTKSFDHKTSYVIGWGKDHPTSRGTKNLKYATLPIYSNSNCRKFWDVSDKNICTAPGLGEDACQGDSGGPLLVMEDNEPLQVGVVSYGDMDCPSNKPGVFTRVSMFSRWIQSVIQ